MPKSGRRTRETVSADFIAAHPAHPRSLPITNSMILVRDTMIYTDPNFPNLNWCPKRLNQPRRLAQPSSHF